MRKPKYRITRIMRPENNFEPEYLLERLIFKMFYFPVKSIDGSFWTRETTLDHWIEKYNPELTFKR